MPGIADHVFVLLFAFVLPLRGVTVTGRELAALHFSTDPQLRLRFYAHSTALHLLLLGVAMLVWWHAGRSLVTLGLGLPDMVLFGITMLAVGLALLGHWAQGRIGLRRTADRSWHVARLGRLRPLIPVTRTELQRFSILGGVAGFSEEILYRGFLPAYLNAFMPAAAAATFSVLLFGLGHGYQGLRGVIQTTVIGAVLMLLYVVSGSLWPGIVFHAGFNLISGQLGHDLIRRSR